MKITGSLFRFFAFVFLLAGTVNAWPASRGVPVNADSGQVSIRKFDEKALREYRLDKDFNYNEDGGNVSPSLWQRFWAWFWSLLKETGISSIPGSSTFWKWFIITLASGVIIFAVIKFRGMDLSALFTGKPKSAEVPFSESLENIHEISFDEEIEKAIGNHDFRLAVRLLYLKTLKKLSDSGRIKWEPDKTNSTYINELRHPDQKQWFSVLTREFEYIWYGSFKVDSGGFEKIRASFIDFYKETYR